MGGGCCPEGTVPGRLHHQQFMSAQVICGFTSSGDIAMSPMNNNTGTPTCEHHTCYVVKANFKCDNGNQFLNGCCAPIDQCNINDCKFEGDCGNYEYAMSDDYGGNRTTKYCVSFKNPVGT